MERRGEVIDDLGKLKNDRKLATSKIAYLHRCQVEERGSFTGMCKLAAYWLDELRMIDRRIYAVEKKREEGRDGNVHLLR
jgi:hypothetical protein